MLNYLKEALLTISSIFILSLSLVVIGAATTTNMAMAAPAGGGGGSGGGATIEVEKCIAQGGTLIVTNSGCDEDKDTAPAKKVTDFIAKLLNIISLAVAIVAVIMIIAGGFRYVASGGKTESVQGAKNMILYALIGLVIVALAQAIVRVVIQRLIQ